jgi:hypothetical protein
LHVPPVSMNASTPPTGMRETERRPIGREAFTQTYLVLCDQGLQDLDEALLDLQRAQRAALVARADALELIIILRIGV